MNVSKQVIIGVAVLVSGIGLLYGTLNQVFTTKVEQTNNTQTTNAIASTTTHNQTAPDMASTSSMVAVAVVGSQVYTTSATDLSPNQQDIPTHDVIQPVETPTNNVVNTPVVSDSENAIESSQDDITYPVVMPRTNTPTQTKTSQEKQQPNSETTNKTEKKVEPTQITTKNTQTQPKADNQTQPKPVAQETIVKKTTQSTTETTKKTIPTKTEKTNIRPTSYQVQRGEGLIVLSRRFDVPLDVLAKFNNLDKNATLNAGQTLKIPTHSEIQKLQKQIAEQQQQQQLEAKKKQRYQEANEKLKEARQAVKETGTKEMFGVQVALASNEANAQEVVKKLKEAGYKTKTSPTTQGIRIVVGPEMSKEAAHALRDKINNDIQIPIDNAWVLKWQ